jgi:hypothetical protein
MSYDPGEFAEREAAKQDESYMTQFQDRHQRARAIDAHRKAATQARKDGREADATKHDERAEALKVHRFYR